mmetsp:Transcript_16413/g.54549  ORF Transcript_16413/g.54549 Transcript_16413/m.54549 type:complete len:227 (-) Transcript_16413:171-851(-)
MEMHGSAQASTQRRPGSEGEQDEARGLHPGNGARRRWRQEHHGRRRGGGRTVSSPRHRVEHLEHRVRGGDGAKDSALHRHHLVCRCVVASVGRARAVCDEAALESAVVCLAHRSVHAHVRRDAAEQQPLAACRAQQVLEVGGKEGALAGLVDDILARQRPELVDQLPARLAAHQHPTARPGLPDLGADRCRPQPLVLREVSQTRPMALSRVDDAHARGTSRRQHAL